MKQLLTLAICILSTLPILGAEKDAEFFLKLRDTKDAKRESATLKDVDVFTFFGNSLGSEIFCKAEGGISKRGGGSTWTTLVERRIVEGGFLVESKVRSHPETKDKSFAFLPMTVTWFDRDSFPEVAIRRVVLTERDEEIVIIERWRGVLWFSQDVSRLQWIRYAARPLSRTYNDSDEIAPRQLKMGEFIGCAFEDLDKEGFPTLFTVEPAGNGIEAWREIRWKK